MIYIIKRPLITEKNSQLSEANTYAFEVATKATKTEIKFAVEKSFRVKVESVNTVNCRGRGKRTAAGMSKPKYWKKAFIKLKPGEKITLFEGA